VLVGESDRVRDGVRKRKPIERLQWGSSAYLMNDRRQPPIRLLVVDASRTFLERASHTFSEDREGVEVATETDAGAALDHLDEPGVDGLMIGDPADGDVQSFVETVAEDRPDLALVVLDRGGKVPAAADRVVEYDGGDVDVVAERVLDFVDLRRTSGLLDRRTELHRTVERLARVGGWEFDVEAEQLTWTDGVRRIHEVPLDYEPTLEEAIEFYHEADMETIREAVETAIETGEPYKGELRIRTAEGNLRWVRPRIERQGDRLVGSFRDITGDKLDAQRLREYNRTIEALYDAAADISAAETPEEVAELTVTAAAQLLDFSMCSVLYHRDGWLEPIATSEASPEGGVRRVRVAHEGEGGLAGKTFREGESFVVDDVGADDVSDPADESYRSGISVPIGEHGVFQAVENTTEGFDERDVELCELLIAHAESAFDDIEKEAELARKNERLDSFARVVSHDLRNSLEVARGNLELARRTDDPEYLAEVDDVIDRMERFVEDALVLGRNREPEIEPVDVENLARLCWTAVSPSVGTLSVGEAGVISANPEHLERLFENLFRNAIEHGTTADGEPETDGGGITIRVGSLPDGFYVEDDGTGISPERREEVFEKGISGAGGPGLGLPIVQEIARNHGWTVSVTESEEGGARFEFTGVETPTEGA